MFNRKSKKKSNLVASVKNWLAEMRGKGDDKLSEEVLSALVDLLCKECEVKELGECAIIVSVTYKTEGGKYCQCGTQHGNSCLIDHSIASLITDRCAEQPIAALIFSAAIAKGIGAQAK